MRTQSIHRSILVALLFATASLQASASARAAKGELRRDCAEAAFGREGEQTRVATLAPLPTATQESVDFAAGALDKMDAGMQDLVDKKHLAGIVTLVARKGKAVDAAAALPAWHTLGL